MTDRERRLATLAFGKPDRIPLEPGYGRESTLKRWHSEGLPANLTRSDEITAFAYRAAGGREELPVSGEGFPVDLRMIPQFEEKVLEHRGTTQVVQDWKGNVCEIGAEFDVTYLRTALDFVTRRWIRCPVESRSDWLDVARRYDPADPARLPDDAADRARRLADRGWMIGLWVPGPFWQLREWLGFERLCTLFYDDLPFLRQLIGFWSTFVALVLERTFSVFVPDEIHLNEDMAFKGFSMISPAMVREHLLPVWTRWGRLAREAGCPVYGMDSDGFVGELIPLWIEAGITVCDPVEVAAGNDLAAFRARFGPRMAFRGGIDKRAIAKGGQVIEQEIARRRPVIDSGGYIPGCDHAVPPDVSWPDFVRYVGLLARATGWR
jgi:uroporphyrinogen decarboxylase